MKKHDLHYDPLYRVIEEMDERHIIEGNFKAVFDRLREINNLGIIPEIFGMARYSKYEHHLGTLHQVKRLIDETKEKVIDSKYIIPMKLSALFLHTGHLPFTYSTERALLLASNLGNKDEKNKVHKYLENKIDNVLEKTEFDNEKKENYKHNIFSMKDDKKLYRFLSANILLDNWSKIKRKIEDDLDETDLKIIIKNLIEEKNDGYEYLNLADKADYVQRDALYFGTVKLDIPSKHLYEPLSKYEPEFSVSEEKLLQSNLNYLNERFYDNKEVNWFSILYQKVLSVLFLSDNFDFRWLEDPEYGDEEFKRLISQNLNKNNKETDLISSKKWIEKMDKLLNNDYNFRHFITLDNLSYNKNIDIIDIEYDLLSKRESNKGLAKFPFDNGILLNLDYSKSNDYPTFEKYNTIRLEIYQDEKNDDIYWLLKILNKLEKKLTIFDFPEESQFLQIKKSFGKSFSWTDKVRIDHDALLSTLALTLADIEKNQEYDKGEFLRSLLNAIMDLKTYDELWHNFGNYFIIDNIKHSIDKHENELLDEEIYHIGARFLLLLPSKIWKYKSIKSKLKEIKKSLKNKLNKDISSDKKGNIFEVLSWIERISDNNCEYKMIINNLVVQKSKQFDNKDKNEFDIIELIINENDSAECWIYSCSISNNYKEKNKEKLTKLAESINETYPGLKIRTRYMVPNEDWEITKIDAGRNFH